MWGFICKGLKFGLMGGLCDLGIALFCWIWANSEDDRIFLDDVSVVSLIHVIALTEASEMIRSVLDL